jgi:SAM-dependent methyltransferase
LLFARLVIEQFRAAENVDATGEHRFKTRWARGWTVKLTEAPQIDFQGRKDSDAEFILEWPDEFISSLKDRLLALHTHSELSPYDVAELREYRLIDGSTGQPTALGERLVDLIVRETWQEGSEHESLERMGIEGSVCSVLEIGCSTGWALRSLGLSPAARRIGIDIDAKAVALGYRLGRYEKRDCSFFCSSAHALPLADGSVDAIICRNAITYLHQGTALKEMGRVLSQRGLIFIRYENIWYDLMRLSHPGSLVAMCFKLRDFLCGLIPEVIGWEPGLGSAVRGGRAFSTQRRLKRILRDCGCVIERTEASLRCPSFLGFATQTSMLARKVRKQPGEGLVST